MRARGAPCMFGGGGETRGASVVVLLFVSHIRQKCGPPHSATLTVERLFVETRRSPNDLPRDQSTPSRYPHSCLFPEASNAEKDQLIIENEAILRTVGPFAAASRTSFASQPASVAQSTRTEARCQKARPRPLRLTTCRRRTSSLAESRRHRPSSRDCCSCCGARGVNSRPQNQCGTRCC